MHVQITAATCTCRAPAPASEQCRAPAPHCHGALQLRSAPTPTPHIKWCTGAMLLGNGSVWGGVMAQAVPSPAEVGTGAPAELTQARELVAEPMCIRGPPQLPAGCWSLCCRGQCCRGPAHGLVIPADARGQPRGQSTVVYPCSCWVGATRGVHMIDPAAARDGHMARVS
jgi:hypothetical protein